MNATVRPSEADACWKAAALVLTGHAPGGPLVDHQRIAAQDGETRVQRARATGQDLIGLGVQRGQWRGRALKARVDLRERQPGRRSRGGGARELDQSDDEQRADGEDGECHEQAGGAIPVIFG